MHIYSLQYSADRGNYKKKSWYFKAKLLEVNRKINCIYKRKKKSCLNFLMIKKKNKNKYIILAILRSI